jgi:hypothetical protein
MGHEDYGFLEGHLRPLGQSIRAFSMDTDVDVLLTNRGQRELSDHERQRINEQYTDGRYRSAFGEIVGNTTSTAEQTAQQILARLENDTGIEQ